MVVMVGNMIKALIKLLYIVLSNCSSILSIVLSFILENFLNIGKYIPVLKKYAHELNISLYTVIISKLLVVSKKRLSKHIINIECYIYDNKEAANKERYNNTVERKIGEDPSRLYLRIKYSGYYKELKNHDLVIRFPTWVDLNDFIGTSLLSLDEKEIEKGLSPTNIIIDFSKLGAEGDEYVEGSRIVPLDIIMNSLENLGCEELVEIKIKSKEKIKMYQFKSNTLKIFSEI